MRPITVILILLVSLRVFGQDVGYLVSVQCDTAPKPAVTPCFTLAAADSIIDRVCGVDMPTGVLVEDGYFDMRTNRYYVYCELKAVRKDGKLSRKRAGSEEKIVHGVKTPSPFGYSPLMKGEKLSE